MPLQEQRKVEEAALAAEAEAAAAKAAEEAAAQEEESDDLGWEDMDLDAVKLPGDEPEPVPEPEPEPEPAPTPAEEVQQTSTSKVCMMVCHIYNGRNVDPEQPAVSFEGHGVDLCKHIYPSDLQSNQIQCCDGAERLMIPVVPKPRLFWS